MAKYIKVFLSQALTEKFLLLSNLLCILFINSNLFFLYNFQTSTYSSSYISCNSHRNLAHYMNH